MNDDRTVIISVSVNAGEALERLDRAIAQVDRLIPLASVAAFDDPSEVLPEGAD